MQAVAQTASLFRIDGEIIEISPFGGGHINSTWKVSTSKSTYLLQKINTLVFTQPGVIIRNRQYLEDIEGKAVLVEQILTKAGELALENEAGFFRMQAYMANTYAPSKVEVEEQAFQAAKGFGEFLSQTQTLDTSLFSESIPGFHDLEKRLLQLAEAVGNNRVGRLDSAASLLNQANDFLWIKNHMKTLKSHGLPVRVCHNDTKVDNILLDRKSHEFKHVIDLDTVGPGFMLYDFGDMMRTFISPAAESETDISKIEFRKSILEALKEGFMSSVQHFITPNEKESLYFGGMYMTYIMAVRFLTDYLNGDIYYKIHFENENFVRSRNQLYLLSLMNKYKVDFKN